MIVVMIVVSPQCGDDCGGGGGGMRCAAKMSLHDLNVPCTTRHPDCHIDGRDADIEYNSQL